MIVQRTTTYSQEESRCLPDVRKRFELQLGRNLEGVEPFRLTERFPAFRSLHVKSQVSRLGAARGS